MNFASFTDTSEKGLEDQIVADMSAAGWIMGQNADYNREHALDLTQLRLFLEVTQPPLAAAINLEHDSMTRRKFLARLQGEITKRGVVDVLRNGLQHEQHKDITLFYSLPSPDNLKAVQNYEANRFSLTRQLRYSRDETLLALDLCLFVNGLPVATFELKNSLTKQTTEDAVSQYKTDRSPQELLFAPKRCAVHFAVDDARVQMCAKLEGKASWFLPFDRGWDDGAGNPPSDGLKTAYLWQEILSPRGLSDILENYAAVVKTKDPKTGKAREALIFPRYHQLDAVRDLLADAKEKGAGCKYLIQHSAGSGKSNSIAWLAHQLVGLKNAQQKEVFDSVIVITDRTILDAQLNATIKGFTQVGSILGHANSSAQLRQMIEGGKKIIVSTLQKFPFVLKHIGSEHRERRFAIILDEAHSSQGSRLSASISRALGALGEEIKDDEDAINYLMASRRLASNASYFAFTATPKPKTLETFGVVVPGEDGKIGREPFHKYTMKQAIQERFILDVLAHYTPVKSYYRLVKSTPDDPEFDAKRAQKKLRRFVESNETAIRLRAEIMVDHFHDSVLAAGKIGGQARAMVVCSGIERAIATFHAIRSYLQERKSPHQAVVAFSGEHEWGGVAVTEESLNGFPSRLIAEKIAEEPYRFLVCADKFQTGYDEPLLHTMYVDKPLGGITAVQTLSRLNRAHPKKHDTFVLDFYNDAQTITDSFAPYYRTTLLSEESDPNVLHDLKATLDGAGVYGADEIATFVSLYLNGAGRPQLDPILDGCVERYRGLGEDGQVEFKGTAKTFGRTYEFLASLLPYNNEDWEKLSIFLQFLVPKLPSPREEDASKGILEAIDMDSYRVEKQAVQKLLLPDEDGALAPLPAGSSGGTPEAELQKLSDIVRSFNDLFGNINWNDADRVGRLILQDIAPKVLADAAVQNARKNSGQSATKLETNKALEGAMLGIVKDDTQLFKEFQDNDSFKRWLQDKVFALVYGGGSAGDPTQPSP